MEAIYNFDYAILNWMQTNVRSDVMDVIMKAFTYLSEGGIFWIAIAAIMLIPRKTRKYGLAIGAALILGIIFGNGLLKNAIARLRPYDPACAYSYLKMNVELIIKTPWDYSFPSGHTLAAFEAATVLTIWKKKVGIPTFVVAIIVGISRIYLYVHYPTDVLGGMILGIICGIVGYIIVNAVYDKAAKAVSAKINKHD